MLDPMDFVRGGLVPLVAAAAAFALAWATSRRGAAAWSAGVIVGFAAGALALEARSAGVASAAGRWLHPSEAQQWLPAIALIGALPALIAALSWRRWVEWALAAPLCIAAPARLLWSKYRASAQLRDAGFADDAISPAGAAAVVIAIGAATLAAWWLWRRTPEGELPKSRSLLAIVAAVGAAAVAALTGALVIGQTFGVLAAALGGCAATAWIVGARAGPEAARGPVLLLFAGLLAAAVGYSELLPWQAATLAAAFVLPVGGLPQIARTKTFAQIALRTALCLIPLTAVAWNAAATFAANERNESEEGKNAPYDDYFAPAVQPAGQ